MTRLTVVGIKVSTPSQDPVLILREEKGQQRALAVWVGLAEADAIAQAIDGNPGVRPRTHELLVQIIDALEAQVRAVVIDQVSDGVFHSYLKLTTEQGSEVRVPARTSDAVAVALWCDVPVVADERIINEHGIVLTDPEAEDSEVAGEQTQRDLARFAQFIDEVDPDDFA